MHVYLNTDYKWNMALIKKNMILFFIGYVLCLISGTINFSLGYEKIPYLAFYAVFFIKGVLLAAAVKNRQLNHSVRVRIISAGICLSVTAAAGTVLNRLIHVLCPDRFYSLAMLFIETVVLNRAVLIYMSMLMHGYYICSFTVAYKRKAD